MQDAARKLNAINPREFYHLILKSFREMGQRKTVATVLDTTTANVNAWLERIATKYPELKTPPYGR